MIRVVFRPVGADRVFPLGRILSSGTYLLGGLVLSANDAQLSAALGARIRYRIHSPRRIAVHPGSDNYSRHVRAWFAGHRFFSYQGGAEPWMIEAFGKVDDLLLNSPQSLSELGLVHSEAEPGLVVARQRDRDLLGLPMMQRDRTEVQTVFVGEPEMHLEREHQRSRSTSYKQPVDRAVRLYSRPRSWDS